MRARVSSNLIFYTCRVETKSVRSKISSELIYVSCVFYFDAYIFFSPKLLSPKVMFWVK